MNELILTRYLYSKIEVKQSMLVALLERNIDEALFWAYELYFSKFEDELYQYVISIYEYFYQSQNKTLRSFIETSDIGSIITTLCMRNYVLAPFMKAFFQLVCEDTLHTSKRNSFTVQMTPEDIAQYETKPVICLRTYLKEVCKYSVRKEVNRLFNNPIPKFTQEYRIQWLYYASKCPLWLDRIYEYEGIVDDVSRCIVFPSEEEEEDFYAQWNLEPDEQPLDIQKKSIGCDDGEIVTMTPLDFCLKFGAKVKDT